MYDRVEIEFSKRKLDDAFIGSSMFFFWIYLHVDDKYAD